VVALRQEEAQAQPDVASDDLGARRPVADVRAREAEAAEALVPAPCNINRLQDTLDTYHGVKRSLPHQTAAAVARALRAAQAAANRGHCAEMHKHAGTARAALDRRLDMLLGRPRRRRRTRTT
jgi:hypothetical protein